MIENRTLDNKTKMHKNINKKKWRETSVDNLHDFLKKKN